ncbi:MAG: hypothetical protein IIV16_04585 [Alistipes sp.]|nr:hypothetical protein [Alistipes sp.]
MSLFDWLFAACAVNSIKGDKSSDNTIDPWKIDTDSLDEECEWEEDEWEKEESEWEEEY